MVVGLFVWDNRAEFGLHVGRKRIKENHKNKDI